MSGYATATDTWGIPSSLFLIGYLLLAIASVIASAVLRRRYLRIDAGNYRRVGALTPAETGMLFDDWRALIAALAHLRSIDLVNSTGATARPMTSYDRSLDPFTRSVHERLAASGPLHIRALRYSLAGPYARLRESLIRRGLLTGPAQEKLARKATLPILVVIVVGVVRIIAGAFGDKPVGGLVAITLMLVLVRHFMKSTRRETVNGATEKAGATGLTQPGNDWVSPGLAAAVGGGAALWLFDPALASAIAVPNSARGFWSSATASSDSGGGDSGDGGSSCGGGCGGGCGG